MNQLYAEVGVKRQNTPKTIAFRCLLIFGILVGLILLVIGGLFSALGVAIIVVMVFLYPKLNIEYEYVYVDGQIDFDKITAKSRRKTMLRLDMEQVEIVAVEGSHALDNYTNIQLEKRDFTSGKKENTRYIIIANMKEKKLRVAFEPSETMLSMIKQKSPRKVSQY